MRDALLLGGEDLVPPLLVLVDRGETRARGLSFGSVFARCVPLAPRAILALSIAVVTAGGAMSAVWIAKDPMEYDLAKVQNDRARTADLRRAWEVANEVFGGREGAMAVLADTLEEAREIDRALEERWRAAPANDKPFRAVTSVFRFVPPEQESKIRALLRLKEKLERAHERGFVSEPDWARLRPLLPPSDLRPFGVADLPRALALPFTERDGARGKLVLVEPEPSASEDLRYLLRYSASFREIALASGKVLRGSGRAIIFADVLEAVVRDIPRAIGLSLLLTLGVVLLAFRRVSHALPVLFALAVGVGAFLWLARIKLNFLNFAALPVTFGIGVDYAVNVAQRYHQGGGKDILGALRTTGGAVVLCSMTTTFGYLALLGSHNQAIRGLGLIAVVGEVSCLLAAVLVLPAFWLVVERARAPLGART